MTPFDFINAITENKKDLFEDPQASKDYTPFMINKGLSFYPDTILYANEMNQRVIIPTQWQFEFLKNSIIKKKRFSKWHKKDVQPEQVRLVMKHYKYSEKRAYEIIELLTPNQIEEIRLSYETGGRG
jgi:hypothetical protein